MSINNTEEKDFLGRGWGFPPTFSKPRKSVEMLSGEADILSSLEILFHTSLGERFMRPRYGSRVPDMVFEPLDSSQRAILKRHIQDAVALYEPRITLNNVEITMDVLIGKVEIFIDFKVNATNSRRNFVYPFYIIEGTEVTK